MTADRKTIINGNKLEEYYWNGKMVVYINNHLTEMSYDEAVKSFNKEK
jgi:hypothetical protein